MNVAEKIIKIQEVKDAIKQAIIDKGVEVTDNDSFKSYADKIESIPGGDAVINPAKLFNGLSFYIDSQCNTRSGYDTSVAKFEPLVITPNDSETSECIYNIAYQSGYTGTWNGKFINLGAKGAFKVNHRVYNDEMTVEMVFRLTEESEGKAVYLFHACNPAIVKGASDNTKYPNRLTASGLSDLPAEDMFLPEINKIYYLVLTYKVGEGATLLLLPDNHKITNPDASYETGLSKYTTCIGNTGYKSASVSSSDSIATEGLELGMIRCWNRVLSDSEIEENFQEVKARFEF